MVAPHAGAWIETSALQMQLNPKAVAPHAGAWIETGWIIGVRIDRAVAPHAGAWIETLRYRTQQTGYPASRPTRARGLKRA